MALRSKTARVEIGAVSGGELVVGDRVFINQGSTIVAHRHITIGDDTRIGDNCAVYDSNFHQVSPGEVLVVRPVTIGKGVWLARSVVVLPGVEIGDYAVIGAASVVHKDVPSGALMAGNPAQLIRQLDVQPGWRRT